MPRYQAPTSDADRTTALKKQIATAASDAEKNLTYVEPETTTAQTAFLPTWQPAYDVLDGFLQHRKDDVKNREAARLLLDTTLRDFFEVLRRRVHRRKEPASVLAFYTLPASGETPNLSGYDNLREIAGQVLKGDVAAAAAGHPAMANPDATELQAALTAADDLATAVPTSDRAYDLAQQAVAALRPRMDELIDDGIKDIRNRTRKLDGPGQRRILRTYGAQFVSLRGEAPEAEEPPPTTPAGGTPTAPA
jgi:hypothetical protein